MTNKLDWTHVVDQSRQPVVAWQNHEPQNQQIPANYNNGNWRKKSSRVAVSLCILYTQQHKYAVQFTGSFLFPHQIAESERGKRGLLFLITPHQYFFSMKIFSVKRSSISMSVVHELLFGQMVRKKKDKRLITFTDFDVKISTFSLGLMFD
ncbi:unnamed protein product [Coffea canephora]|uniref:Uncharacterized protein n=1 Tax=Coffea canephora TaxID=49390 RepID=A0A068TMZ7_COFCA|nr:unnamed protein product [Coffea canephora]